MTPHGPQETKRGHYQIFSSAALFIIYAGSFIKPGACDFNYKTQVVSSRNLNTSAPYNYVVLR